MAFNVVHNLTGLTELHEKLTFLWSNSHSIIIMTILSRGEKETTIAQVDLQIALNYLSSQDIRLLYH